ncbi:MAG: DUF1501 domain-containing protein [Phycisphaerae bacterium]
MSITRREFIAGGTSLLASGLTLPAFLNRTAVAAARAKAGERILVVVQLTGGNDGLNTVIPCRDDEYHKARPTLAVPKDRVLRLDDDLGLHPDMTGLKKLFDAGRLCVVNNVGYPNPDRSHFRSMDIWHTAALQPEEARDGWLGRVVDRQARPGGPPPALHLDEGSLPLALHSRTQPVPSIPSLEAFRLSARAGELEQAIAAGRSGASDDLLFVQRTAIASCANARRIEQAAADETRQASYPPTRLAGRLKQIAQLIGADLGPRIYYTSIGGFDTHAQQALAHGPLLKDLSDALAAFDADLQARGLADRVLLMTFSEFGRRVKENGSRGTDHGAAAPLFVAGPACRAGIVGGRPDLDHLQDGDVPHRIDFRSVYATILTDWLELKADEILGKRYDQVSLLKTRS